MVNIGGFGDNLIHHRSNRNGMTYCNHKKTDVHFMCLQQRSSTRGARKTNRVTKIAHLQKHINKVIKTRKCFSSKRGAIAAMKTNISEHFIPLVRYSQIFPVWSGDIHTSTRKTKSHVPTGWMLYITKYFLQLFERCQEMWGTWRVTFSSCASFFAEILKGYSTFKVRSMSSRCQISELGSWDFCTRIVRSHL